VRKIGRTLISTQVLISHNVLIKEFEKVNSPTKSST